MDPTSPPPAATKSGSSNLDTALLETIFYNEMMLMDESSSLSSDFLAYLSSDGGPASAATSSTPAPVDASAIAEKALLRDFGVSSTPEKPPPAAWVAPERRIETSTSTTMPVPPPPSHPGAPVATPQPVAPPPPPVAPVAAMPASQPPTATTDVSKERAEHLVSQFATLASRLGISLPPNVLSSLTDVAAHNEEARTKTGEPLLDPSTLVVPAATTSSSSTVAQAASTLPTTTVSTTESSSSEPTPELVKHLRHTAEAAIASVSETRKRTKEECSNNNEPATKPLYSKRRKKPRLSDCQAKLDALKAENEMLKRHLDTVAHQSSKFEAERKQTEMDLKKMVKECAQPEQLNPILHKYSEMYSDYGRHRNQELLFHLQQLEKLAAPTNFTKMGLWSLGQSEGFYTNPKQNPIAGILRKELGITPLQGRKILDQRQKIRDVCDNLKQCLSLLTKLKGLCEEKQKMFHDRMSKCQEILTPSQVAKLLLWVDEHSHLLESVCPGWGSERIRTKEKKEQQE